jgi:SAM-dependent methyltransferase
LNINKDKISNFYKKNFNAYGDSFESVGWGDVSSQYLRFQKLTDGLIKEGSSILDYGCGLGHFVDYLENQHLKKYQYVGIDLCDSFIKHAMQKYHSKKNINFYTGDISQKNLRNHSFDIAIASGVFSLKQENIETYTFQTLSKMFELVDESVSVNFLTKHCDYELEKNIHHDPSAILKEAFKITSNLRLLHDYELYEFTLILNK